MGVDEHTRAVELLCELIRLDTSNPPGNEHRVSQALEKLLNREGVDVRVEMLDRKGNRSNVEAVLRGDGPSRLMFCGHMDTVAPWDKEAGRYPPHGAVIADNRIYGRGASDMKSGLAAMLLAFLSIQRDGIRLGGDLVFLATAGEEVDSCGAAAYESFTEMREFDGVVIGEPTGSRIVVGHKGALWLRIELFGLSAHGSMPKLGTNAVEAMAELIAIIKACESDWAATDPILGASSLAVTKVSGGVQTNIIPDRCEAELDLRFVPPIRQDQLLKEIESRLQDLQAVNQGLSYRLTPILERQPVVTSIDDPLIRTAIELAGDRCSGVRGVSYYTDASVLNRNSAVPILIYGPGDERLAHQPDESVDIDAYLDSIDFYRELAIRFLGR
ncbi:M20 family metallopeptidase [Cohnella sp. AR92]|uniref:M20 family metallopeptidase n=1 Tax=Cohnella sp. AR92 TaxID=648716 RepID=UPI000F8F398F|nr:M20 family metallopeptidase [Cohnella sp. AR92]RUS47065.1 M20 family peptidase [Cohnella sp. AR92]